MRPDASPESGASVEASCIYCSRKRPDVDFTREHVVQRGFAPFADALVLHDAVCGECNQYFANTLDIALTRSSVEGLERYRWSVKPPEELDNFDYQNVTLRLKDGGDFEDATLQLAHANVPGGIVLQLIPRVGMRNRGDEGFTWFTEEEIRTGAWRANELVDWNLGIKVLGDSISQPRLSALLNDQGVRPSVVRDLVVPIKPGDEATVEHEFMIPETIQRAFAKIAFNYLAFVEGAAFCSHPALSSIRRFIRYGESSSHIPPIYSSWQLPFRLSTDLKLRPVVHFVGLTTHKSHSNLLGVVSLFGFMCHTVVLATDFEGPWPILPKAHMYNVKRRSVVKFPDGISKWQNG